MKDFLCSNSSFVKLRHREDDTYISGGYVQRKMEHFRHINHPNSELTFNQKQFDSFEKICSLIKSENIRLVLVYAPITSSIYKSYSNNNEFEEKMSSYGDYYNFNKIIRLDDSLHFYDTHHLNQKGIEIFNKKLIEVLLKQ